MGNLAVVDDVAGIDELELYELEASESEPEVDDEDDDEEDDEEDDDEEEDGEEDGEEGGGMPSEDEPEGMPSE